MVEVNTTDDERGIKGYSSMTEALIDANGPTPVILCKDVEIDSYDSGDHRGFQVIDLNGHTLTINNLYAGNHLEVRNGTLNCIFNDYSMSNYYLNHCGELVLDNATVNFRSVWNDEGGY